MKSSESPHEQASYLSNQMLNRQTYLRTVHGGYAMDFVKSLGKKGTLIMVFFLHLSGLLLEGLSKEIEDTVVINQVAT